jgi:hypothetical protein
MSTRIRERELSHGEVSFPVDVNRKDSGRFVQSTGIKVNPKILKAYNQAKLRHLTRYDK